MRPKKPGIVQNVVVTGQRDVEALEVQRKTLDMALKIKGMYAPERHEHTGKNGGPIRTEVTELKDEELTKIASGDNRKPTP